MNSIAQTFKQPDKQELRAVVDDCYPDLMRFFLFRGFSRDEARDLVQQTLLEALRSDSGYRGDGSLKGWILGIAKNVYRSELRYRGREKRAGHEMPLEEWMTQEPSANPALVTAPQALNRSLAAERSRLLREALGALTEGQRNCLVLRTEQDLSYREIAQVLQISVEAVKVRLFAAKKKLRILLSEQFEIDLD